ncbi:MAG: RluA family pseudouridine synthase [Planctomycetota bacterium]|nr:RluA family pseudouridine synthase [Planctomycetota bacterium]MCX8040566.1 RluA family pseudouridine synthase [Planctomycetota bacterium]MDW8372186.1 RluA family pseudouridine synthase [Planctomycetota bacterium]
MARKRALAAAAPRRAPHWRPGPGARVVGVEVGQRLAAFVARRLGISHRAAKRLIERGGVRVDGVIETFASRTLRRGEIVEVFPELAPREHAFEARRLVFQSPDLFAYDKPAGLAVTRPDDGEGWSLCDLLAQALPPPLIPVHRLDADTSGIVLFARSEQSARALEALFRAHQVRKTYLAIVRGHPRAQGSYRSYLVCREKGPGYERWASGRGPDARCAETSWELLERLGPYGSLLAVRPTTGRHHQIRIHFSEIGHPLYGDLRYGDRRDPVQAPRHMLHAWRVELPDPASGEPLRIATPVPAEFTQLAEALRRLS